MIFKEEALKLTMFSNHFALNKAELCSKNTAYIWTSLGVASYPV